ncbi:MAG: acylphosphatase [candidate division WOR-3 bacterium]
MQRLHIWVSGIVQGVGFRYFTIRQAREIGISGWVRNLPDGRVEIVAEGESWRLKEFLENIKVGPSHATVTKVEVREEEYKKEFEGFEVRF